MYMLNIYVCQAPDRCAARRELRFRDEAFGYGPFVCRRIWPPKVDTETPQEVRAFHHAEPRAVPTSCTCIRRSNVAGMRLECFGEPLDFVDGGRLSPHNGSGAVADTVTRGQLTGLWHTPVGERQLPLHEIAIHPHDAVSTHDRVDGVRLQREGVRVRACDSSAREEVETPLTARVAVNHAYRSLPSGFLARPLRDDTRLR